MKNNFEKKLLESLGKFLSPHDIAQFNASLPKTLGGLGLHRNNTTEERAQAMGYNTRVYHGTNHEFDKFDRRYIGRNFIDSRDGGFFFSQSKERASRYGSNVNEYLVKHDNPHIVNTPEIDERFEDPNYPTKQFYNPIDVYDRRNADLLHSAHLHDKNSIIVKGFKNDDLHVMFNPSHIRKPDAAFDPMKVNDSNLYA